MADSGCGESASGGVGRINGAVDKDAHRAPIVPGGEMVPLVQRYSGGRGNGFRCASETYLKFERSGGGEGELVTVTQIGFFEHGALAGTASF